MSYLAPAAAVETVSEVKKSRFITRAGYADSREAAMAMLAQAKQDYPDAGHHCWAYLLGNPKSAQSAAMSDDGEPSGTAGKPILNVLQHKGVGDVMVIVIRYFGGVKLGAGGLVRAYSGAAQQAMVELPVQLRETLTSISLSCDFRHEQVLRLWLDQHGARNVTAEYAEQVTLSAELPQDKLTALQEFAAGLGVTLTVAE
ncbi:YigZ family protein [Hahella aquimaris]|uniref:YigZ family protein n=1 Tax=Hahella sp. HNIBRBA332 TaxID=3015983 RepID=UPI00273C5145|nr:YigZ family protein [Hahella sp. HNIBRBA332]WLQ13204.1 YigZ family protein [Hahella sp. HNIBRBA332]